jgi:hypothetical protein
VTFWFFRLRYGPQTNRLKRSCIHGTYFTHCAWCRLSPPPRGPSEGHGFDGGAGAVPGGLRRRLHGVEGLCTQERLNPEVVNMFGASARYRWATAGSSHDDAHPGPSFLAVFVFTLLFCSSAECSSSAAAASLGTGLGTTITYVRLKLRPMAPPRRRHVAAIVTLPLCT